MKIFFKLIISCLLSILVLGCTSKKPETTVGIVVPLEHRAMNEIVAGFSQTLLANYAKPVKIQVENAQNDPNLERAIMQKMRDEQDALILPIGMDATQMALSIAHDRPIISLASDLSEQDRKKLKSCNLAVVHDEISPQKLMQFLHAAYPQVQRITLVHSTANKVFPEVKDAIMAAKSYGIQVQDLMVSSLPELYSASKALAPTTQGIFILKDNLIASGISTLEQAATARHIFLMTSDQGTVQEGAEFALGVHEREIGVQGALLAIQALKGAPLCSLPIIEMTHLTVFINSSALKQTEQDSTPIIQAARKFSYQIEQA